MNHPALKREVSINKMLNSREPRLRRSDVVLNSFDNNVLSLSYLTELNFEDGDSSPNLKVRVSSPWM